MTLKEFARSLTKEQLETLASIHESGFDAIFYSVIKTELSKRWACGMDEAQLIDELRRVLLT